MSISTYPKVTAFSSKPFHISRTDLINTLIDETIQFIQYIWPDDSSKCQGITLKVFIQEILRRSHTSFSTLLTALIYLFRLKSAVVKHSERLNQESLSGIHGQWRCGRRMFLSAIIAATKFLQDKGISNTVWSSLSGLDIREINENERVFLELIEYNIFVNSALFSWWSTLLINKIDNLSNIEGLASTAPVRYQPPVNSTTNPDINKKSKSNSYPSLQYNNTSYHAGGTQFDIELSPPFLESSGSEDEE